MAKNRYRRLVINNNGNLEDWKWMFGRSNISIKDPNGKSHIVAIPERLLGIEAKGTFSMTPRTVADHIYKNILKIPNPTIDVETKQVKQANIPEEKKVFKPIRMVYPVFVVHSVWQDDIGCREENAALDRIFSDPADSKRYVAEMNEKFETGGFKAVGLSNRLDDEEREYDEEYKSRVRWYSTETLLE